MTYIEKLSSPTDIKHLSTKELETLAQEIREAILNRNSQLGGHVGPNLGIVEVSLALHKTFNSPVDKIVWDVSHQCYAHKILTGRKEGFLSPEGMKKISGYTNPDESDHDHFKIGHTSTAVSLATGLAKARDLKGEKHNIIAVLGDGSLSGGEALEGLSNASVLNSNIIIILNDNEMSIAENHGGLYTNLRALRESHGLAKDNIFKALGFEYHYVGNGNTLSDLIAIFQQVKDTTKPTLLHIRTTKGKGYSFAENNKERWHWHVPFNVDDGSAKFAFEGENYNDITYHFLHQKIKEDPSIVIINAGTPGVFGLTQERRTELGKNYVDVGIAEEHGIAFTSGLAKGGCKPVFMVMSSFVQRTYDQLSQDLALNNNPAVILVAWGGISGADMTHLCTFDIPLISNIPNLVYLAPQTKEEYLDMLNWGLEQQNHPVVIRMPKDVLSTKESFTPFDYNQLNTYQVQEKGSKVALILAGSFYSLGKEVSRLLKEKNINPTLINPRYLTGIDKTLLEELKQDHTLVVTLEDGELDGGFGEKIARFYGPSTIKTLCFGAKKEFSDRIPLETLFERYHLKPEQIVQDILSAL